MKILFWIIIAWATISNIIGQQHIVGNILVSIKIQVKCGRLPVTGTVTLKEAAAKIPIDVWQLTIFDKNMIHQLKTYRTLGGNYEVILESSCGVLSKIGTYCNNIFTFEFFDVADDEIFLHYPGVANLVEISAAEDENQVKMHCEGTPLVLRDGEELNR